MAIRTLNNTKLKGGYLVKCVPKHILKKNYFTVGI